MFAISYIQRTYMKFCRALRARDIPDVGGLNPGPRLINRVTGQTVNVRQLPDIIPDSDDSISTAESCKKALSELRKLRKAKLRKAKLRKRQLDLGDDDEDDDEDDDDDDDDEDEDDEDDGMELGPESITVGQNESLFITWADGEAEGASILGTYGLNACTAVLVVGKDGGIVAHLSPIEEDGVEDEFKQAITEKVVNLYNDNKDNLAEAKMWVYTPADAEDALLKQTAEEELEIAYESFRYTPVEETDDEWVDSNVGTAWADFSDQAAIKVVLGNVQRN